MSHFGLRASTVLFSLLWLATAPRAEPIATMSGVGFALNSCWSAPAEAGKSAVTLRFGFKRDGTLIGPPRATAVDVSGDAELRKRFIKAAIDAVERCTPVTLASDLARGIAGRVFTMRFSSPDYPSGHALATPQ